MLLPGDLFDGEAVDDALAAAAFAAIRELAPLPVFLTPGNHDPWSPEGPYGEARWRLLPAARGRPRTSCCSATSDSSPCRGRDVPT